MRRARLTRGTAAVFPRSSTEASSSRVSHSLPKGSVSSTTRAAMKSGRTVRVFAIAALASARRSVDSTSRALQDTLAQRALRFAQRASGDRPGPGG